MKKLVLLFAALLVAGCGEKSSSEGSESASESSTPSNESAEPSVDTAKPPPADPPVAESPSEEPSETPKSLSDADVQRLLKEAVDWDSIEERDGIHYLANEGPLSGWAKKMYDSGQVQALAQFKDGKGADGLITEWHENGQKRGEATIKDGKYDGVMVAWHENGQKKGEITIKDDVMVSEKYWNREGEEVETMEEAQGSESASENPTPSNESAEPSADTAKPPPAEPPVAESPSEESSDTPNSLSDADVERLLKEAVDVDSLEERGDLRHQVNESEPYSGWAKSMYDSGQVQALAQFKDGKPDGLYMFWYDNGQKMAEATKKDGKQDGLATAWHENGQKWREETFKDGKEISAKFWNREGEEVETEEESQGSESASEKPTEEIRKNQTEQKERRKQTGEAQELLERVEQVVRRYLATTSVEEKSRYVRHRARVLPLMREYYRRRELTSARFQSIGDIKPAEVENYPFFGIDVMVEGTSDARLLLVEDCADGELRFDWESEVNYQPMKISDYLEKKPTEAMDFRVYVALDTFYGYEFSDKERYQSLKLTFRDEDEFLFGYIEKGSAHGRGLTALLGNRKGHLPLRLRLRFLPDTGSRRSVLVEKVLGASWVQIEEEKEP